MRSVLAATASDLGVALVVTAIGSAVAALWPWLAAYQRRSRFQALIRRELGEARPVPAKPDARPWWQHLSKRFIHEEVFTRPNVTANRDFILSLDPNIAYHVSQLWTAYARLDLTQWNYHLGELATSREVGSADLRAAVELWRIFQASDQSDASAAMVRMPAHSEPSSPHLFAARLDAYRSLLTLTRVESGVGYADASALTDWYYTGANGLVLSGDALRAFLDVRDHLASGDATEKSVYARMSALRTQLKIDLEVRHPDEEAVGLARPLFRRSS